MLDSVNRPFRLHYLVRSKVSGGSGGVEHIELTTNIIDAKHRHYIFSVNI